MKLHSINTSIGAATLANINHQPQHPIKNPLGWGMIIWGRCDRTTFGKIVCNSVSEWIADYSPHQKFAVVIYSNREDVSIGDRVDFDPVCADALCPSCGSTHYVSSGVNWRCKNCHRQWRKNPQKRGKKAVRSLT